MVIKKDIRNLYIIVSDTHEDTTRLNEEAIDLFKRCRVNIHHGMLHSLFKGNMRAAALNALYKKTVSALLEDDSVSIVLHKSDSDMINKLKTVSPTIARTVTVIYKMKLTA